MGTASRKKTYRPAGCTAVIAWLPTEIRHSLREVSLRTGQTQQELIRRALRRELPRHARPEEDEA